MAACAEANELSGVVGVGAALEIVALEFRDVDEHVLCSGFARERGDAGLIAG